jgi:hypothetical protein
MVIAALIIAALVAAGIWIRMDFRIRYWRNRAEKYQEWYEAEAACFENEQSWRISLELNLQQSREMVSRMIAENAKEWATEEAKRVVH